MKVRAAVRKLCEHCRSVKRRGKVYILCTANPKHKQRQGVSTFAYEAASPPDTGTSGKSVIALSSLIRPPPRALHRLGASATQNAGSGLSSLLPTWLRRPWL